ncbi:hypothetical protein B566_EDAN012106 [Ephemera danica]|nr:hypothetical protein B566_EDAN012106 [Ephemera danica]
MKVGLCAYSGYKIYPGHGKTMVKQDGKVFTFLNAKCESSHLMKRNPRKVTWTVLYRLPYMRPEKAQEGPGGGTGQEAHTPHPEIPARCGGSVSVRHLGQEEHEARSEESPERTGNQVHFSTLATNMELTSSKPSREHISRKLHKVC